MRRRFVPRNSDSHPAAIPFESVEEAWFWCSQAATARLEGARYAAGHSTPRPCEPSDILKVVTRLNRLGVINAGHLRVLATFGMALRSPIPDLREEERASRLWDEALDALATPLRRKGIVA